MRKFIFIFTFVVLCANSYAQSADPFTKAHWQGRINYKDTSGVQHSDLYELILVLNGTCIVTVTTKENGEEVFQDGDGMWSFDENFFRIECDFIDPVIERLPSINLVSVYQFDALKNRFTLLVKPYPDAKNNMKVSFNKVDD
ncbi:hypothetical protein AGMMS50212_06820 [Spirochaetia bacterium]|nr:hypothetical protein AGMMS50212_06820 [Spirochaetia bacterium]